MNQRKNITIVAIVTFICHLSVISQIQYDLLQEQTIFSPAIARHTLQTVKLSSGVKLEYAEQGQKTGTPVIFLHGYSDSWYSFEQVFAMLPESIHAYAVSQRGHGNSDGPKAGYTPEHFAADIADFMRTLKINSAVIVGHSMGGTVAQRFALDFPQMTKAIVLVAAFASFRNNESITELRGIVSKLQDPIDSGFVAEFQKSTIFQHVDEYSFKNYVMESMKVRAGVWKSIAEETLTTDLSMQLGGIRVPTLIIWGDKDLFSPRSDQELMINSIQRSRLLIHGGIGHAVHWEDPRKFTNDLLDFIHSLDPGNTSLTELEINEYLKWGCYF